MATVTTTAQVIPFEPALKQRNLVRYLGLTRTLETLIWTLYYDGGMTERQADELLKSLKVSTGEWIR